jgi:hypothetical protein
MYELILFFLIMESEFAKIIYAKINGISWQPQIAKYASRQKKKKQNKKKTPNKQNGITFSMPFYHWTYSLSYFNHFLLLIHNCGALVRKVNWQYHIKRKWTLDCGKKNMFIVYNRVHVCWCIIKTGMCTYLLKHASNVSRKWISSQCGKLSSGPKILQEIFLFCWNP